MLGAARQRCRRIRTPDRDDQSWAFGITYMARLKPALEARGFEVAVFHATGMGGRAFESLAAQGAFVAVMDFCTQELGNHIHGSTISAGETRLQGAGNAGIPQIVAPGYYDLVDVIGWQELAEKWDGYPTHAHNRLITSVVLREADCLMVATHIWNGCRPAAQPLCWCRLAVYEWDRPGADLHNLRDWLPL